MKSFKSFKTFKSFVNKADKDELLKLHNRVIALYPLLVDHGVMSKNEEGKYGFTEDGSNACVILLQSIVFGNTSSNCFQDIVLEQYGLIRFYDETNEYCITVDGIYAMLGYLLFNDKTDEEIIGMIKEFWK